MRKHTFSTGILAVVILILITACTKSFECTDTIGCVDIAPGEPIKIGVIQALSKGPIQIGKEQVSVIELAVAQRESQLLGHPIKLQIEDEQCLSEGGANAAVKITTQPQMVAILGTTCSGAAATAAKVVSEAGLVMISGVNVAPSLTAIAGKPGADWQPGFLRTVYNGSEQGRGAAVFAFQELGATKAATLNDGDAFTQGLTAIFGKTFTEQGGEVVLDSTINKGDTDMHPVLTAVAISEAEVLFFSLFQPEGDFVVQQIQDFPELEHLLLLGGSAGLQTETFIQSVGDDGLGMYFAVPAPPSLGVANDKLVTEYTAKFGKPPSTSFYGYAYDAANILLLTIEAVAVQEEDGTIHIGRQALRDALYATADFEGVTGSLTCDSFGDCGVGRFDVMQLDDPAAGLEGLKSNVIYTYTSQQ